AGHELHQGFANGRPADVELGGQVDLAQPAAGFELIRPDFAEEAFVDTVRQRACLEHAPPSPGKEPEGVLYTEISRYRWELWSATHPLGKQKMQGPRCWPLKTGRPQFSRFTRAEWRPIKTSLIRGPRSSFGQASC